MRPQDASVLYTSIYVFFPTGGLQTYDGRRMLHQDCVACSATMVFVLDCNRNRTRAPAPRTRSISLYTVIIARTRIPQLRCFCAYIKSRHARNCGCVDAADSTRSPTVRQCGGRQGAVFFFLWPNGRILCVGNREYGVFQTHATQM